MPNITRKKLIISVIIIAAIAIFGFFAVKNLQHKEVAQNITQNAENNASANKTAANATTDIASPEATYFFKAHPTDIVYGDVNAPVTIVEYASLSCSHCATFALEGWPKLKADYVDGGKVKFIYRDFPLNQPALVASMVAICVAEDNKTEKTARYYDFLKALFKTQDAWAFNNEFIEKLRAIAKLEGMSSERFDACVKDGKLQERILKSRLEVSKTLQIQSTPTFLINGEVVNGYSGYDEIKKTVEAKLAEKPSDKK
jgi:protein-disulfide isomerase